MLGTAAGLTIGAIIERPEVDIHIPALCDVEVASALRRMNIVHKLMSDERAKEAVTDLIDLPMTRHTHEGLINSAFDLRQNLSVYDAIYVALAGALSCPLITGDRALAAAPLPSDLEIISY